MQHFLTIATRKRFEFSITIFNLLIKFPHSNSMSWVFGLGILIAWFFSLGIWMSWLLVLWKKVLESRCCGLFVSVCPCRGVLIAESRCRGFLVVKSQCWGFLVLEFRCRGFLVLESRCRGICVSTASFSLSSWKQKKSRIIMSVILLKNILIFQICATSICIMHA